MAGRVMGQCIEKGGVEGHGGGYVTRDFEKLLQSIMFPGTPFFEHFRKSSLLSIHTSIAAPISIFVPYGSCHPV